MPKRGRGGTILARLTLVGVLALPLAASPAEATRLPPTLRALIAPLAGGEDGGKGCLAGMALGGIVLLALAGGPGAVAVALTGPLAAAEMVQGGAALAFLGTSACYVGHTTSPVAALSWSGLLAWLWTTTSATAAAPEGAAPPRPTMDQAAAPTPSRLPP